MNWWKASTFALLAMLVGSYALLAYNISEIDRSYGLETDAAESERVWRDGLFQACLQLDALRSPYPAPYCKMLPDDQKRTLAAR